MLVLLLQSETSPRQPKQLDGDGAPRLGGPAWRHAAVVAVPMPSATCSQSCPAVIKGSSARPAALWLCKAGSWGGRAGLGAAAINTW